MNRYHAIILLTFVLFPCAARANEFIDASYQANRDTVQIVLRSQEPMGPPRVRIERGALRISFSGVEEQRWLAPSVDGEAIRAVAVYPSSGETAVVRITLADNRVLARDAIQVRRHDSETHIRIAREALPGFVDKVDAPSRELAVPVEKKPSNAEPAVEVKRPAEKQAPVATQPSSIFAAPINTATGPRPTITHPLAPAETAGNEPWAGPYGRSIAVMAIVSLVLFGLYGAVRLGLGKRAPVAARSDIDVIGSKRLGPRHQLVVIRALGEDHLLSINAGRTERLASVPIAQSNELTKRADAESDLAGIFSRWQKSATSLQDNADRMDTAAQSEPNGRGHGSANSLGLGLLHFGERKGKSPLEALNLLEAKRLNGSNKGTDHSRFRDRTVG